MTRSTSTKTIDWRIEGMIIERQMRRSDAPSTRPASMTSRAVPSRAARKMMNDQPTPFQIPTSQMTMLALQVWASQSKCTACPANSPRTVSTNPPDGLNK